MKTKTGNRLSGFIGRIGKRDWRGLALQVGLFMVGYAVVLETLAVSRIFMNSFGAGPSTSFWFAGVACVGFVIGMLLAVRVNGQQPKRVFVLCLLGAGALMVVAGWTASVVPVALQMNWALALFLVPFVVVFIPSIVLGAAVIFGILAVIEGLVGKRLIRMLVNHVALVIVGVGAGIAVGSLRMLPTIGAASSLRFVAMMLFVVAVILWRERKFLVHAAAFVVILSIPTNTVVWAQGRILLAQTESANSTLRLLGDADRNSVTALMGAGRTVRIGKDRLPLDGVSLALIEAAGDVSGQRVVIGGGLGHALFTGMTAKKADVVEIEADGMVSLASDVWFGSARERGWSGSLRGFLSGASPQSVDVLVLDGTDGFGVDQPSSSVEFMQVARLALGNNGRLLVLVPDNEEMLGLVSRTMLSSFSEVYISAAEGSGLRVLSTVNTTARFSRYIPLDGPVITDDRYPGAWAELGSPNQVVLGAFRQGCCATADR